jgi:protein-L-isoaspartate(D-aspartate) O-methyltransferase
MARMILHRRLFRCVISIAMLATGACTAENVPAETDWAGLRRQMVHNQLKDRGIKDERVLQAMSKVPRHEFVPEALRYEAYQDGPLPIGQGQTISQPYVVALMTEAAALEPDQRVLEVGTGSGYQAVVLAELVKEVFTIELLPGLANQARARLSRLGYRNIQVRAGDGYQGWAKAAPFDAVLVTCGADHVPEPLFDQLKPGGRLVIPVGKADDEQALRVITKGPHGERHTRELAPVRFVPLRRANAVP